jgi:multidrug efflux pump subunit AcrA (membrane-fusion protein)
MNLRQWTIVAALGIVVGGYGLFRYMSAQKKPPAQKPQIKQTRYVKIEKVRNATILAEVEITGRVAARQKAEIFAEVSGVLLAGPVAFKEGVYFSKDATIFRIDDKEFRLSLAALKSGFQNRVAQMLPDLKLDYPAAYSQWEAYFRSLDVDKDLPPPPSPLSDQERFFVTTRDIYNQYYQIKSQEARLEKYVLKAPFDGVATQSLIDPGTLVRVGQKLGELLNPASLELEAAVVVSQARYLSPGASVELVSDDMPGAWTGAVSRIAGALDPATQTVKVYVAVAGPRLLEGMYLKGKIIAGRIENAVAVEQDRVFNGNQVYVVENDSLLTPKTVEVVQRTGNILILRGLNDGESLVAQTLPLLPPGTVVKTYE